MAEWGLVGYGRSGRVELDFDESIEPAGIWRLSISIGQFSCELHVESPDLLGRWSAFFEDTFRTGRFLDREVKPGVYRHMDPKTLELGRIGAQVFLIMKDGKYDDRYFIKAAGPDGLVMYTPTLEEVVDLIAVVKEASHDAVSE